MPSPPVQGPVEDDLVARAGRLREVDVLVLHDADGSRHSSRAALVAGVEDDLADRRRSAMAADARDRADERWCRGGARRRGGVDDEATAASSR